MQQTISCYLSKMPKLAKWINSNLHRVSQPQQSLLCHESLDNNEDITIIRLKLKCVTSVHGEAMPNITLSVDDEIIKKVRKIAVDKNTTLTQMVRDFLRTVAERDEARKIQSLRELEESFIDMSRDMGRRTWSREDLYER